MGRNVVVCVGCSGFYSEEDDLHKCFELGYP